jgi:hypothetical protein
MCCSAFFRLPVAFSALEAWVVENLLEGIYTEPDIGVSAQRIHVSCQGVMW